MLKKICKHLKDCDSFFTDDLIKKMNNFMYSLIPIFIASLFMHYYQTKMPYLSADIDFGILIDFAIIYIITTIFKYGVKLQKESDETL